MNLKVDQEKELVTCPMTGTEVNYQDVCEAGCPHFVEAIHGGGQSAAPITMTPRVIHCDYN